MVNCSNRTAHNTVLANLLTAPGKIENSEAQDSVQIVWVLVVDRKKMIRGHIFDNGVG